LWTFRLRRRPLSVYCDRTGERSRRRDLERMIASALLAYLRRSGFRVIDGAGRELHDERRFVDGFVHRRV
jgi:hypothetical protein